jgi:TolB-like protein
VKRNALFLACVIATLAGSATLSRADDTRILVVPFSTLNVPDAQRWISRGIQENLVSDLGRTAGVVPVPFTGPIVVENNTTAARLARAASAQLAIRGTAQVVGDQVRVTAQMLDARNGEIVRTASVTGTPADLLKMEDDLSAQLTKPFTPVPTSTATTPAPTSAPQIIIIPAPVYYPNYTYNYPNYDYYPGFYPVIITTTPGNNNHHGHDGDHGHDGSHDGDHGPGGTPTHNPSGGGTGDHFVFNPIPNSDGGLLPIPTGGVLPIPTNNVLPVPNNNILPIPNNNVLPIPTNHVLPLPVKQTSPTPTNNVSPVAPSSPPSAPSRPAARHSGSN